MVFSGTKILLNFQERKCCATVAVALAWKERGSNSECNVHVQHIVTKAFGGHVEASAFLTRSDVQELPITEDAAANGFL